MIRVAPRVAAWGRAVYACLWLAAWATLIAILTAATTGCGAAGRVTTGAACATMLASIGEAKHLDPARAHADLESQSAICSRLAPDGGVQ